MTAELFPSYRNPLALNWPIQGKVFGQSHWKEVSVEDEKGVYKQWVDLSTLDKDGNGQAYVYGKKTLKNHYLIVVDVALATLVYAPGVIAYNLLRIIPIIIYLSGHIFYAYAKQPKGGGEAFSAIAKEHLKQMAYQTWLSIANVIRTPFYLLGFIFGLVYALVDPLNGRKIVASFERAWNHNLDRHRSVWVYSPRSGFLFEGGGDPQNLGKHAYYVPGCYQPNQILRFENGEAKRVESISGKHEWSLKKLESGNSWHVIPRGCHC